MTHIIPAMTMPKDNRIKAGAVSYMVILLVDNVSTVHSGFLLDQNFTCRSRNPVLNILNNLERGQLSFSLYIMTDKREEGRIYLPDLCYLGKLTIATGVHTHDGLLEQMNLRQCTDLVRVEHLLDVRVRRVRVRVIRQDAIAHQLHTFL